MKSKMQYYKSENNVAAAVLRNPYHLISLLQDSQVQVGLFLGVSCVLGCRQVSDDHVNEVNPRYSPGI